MKTYIFTREQRVKNLKLLRSTRLKAKLHRQSTINELQRMLRFAQSRFADNDREPSRSLYYGQILALKYAINTVLDVEYLDKQQAPAADK